MIYWFILILLLLISFKLFLRKKSPPKVTALFIFPIKSCAGIPMSSVQINEFGILFDREWVLLTPDNAIVTQRQDPRLLKLRPSLNFRGSTLISIDLQFENHKFSFEPRKIGEITRFECMSVMAEGMDEGEEVANFLRKVFSSDYRMVRVAKHRQMNQLPEFKGLISDDYHTNFTDAAQFLVVSEESYEKTRDEVIARGKTSKRIELGCFRGNIVVKGGRAFEEDSWARFRIGEVEFQGVARCPRCRVTTVDRETAMFDEAFEPVATLRKINGNGTKGYFGMHCVRLNSGEIAVGQTVEVKETGKFPDI
jgi:uncharacterized protein